jgi:uncharacterized protein YbaR (Trm112 family)
MVDANAFDVKLLDILACPLDDERPPLVLNGDHLVCTVCGSAFPIRNGIPDLLPESAIPPTEVVR